MKFREEKNRQEGQGKWIVTIDGDEYAGFLKKGKEHAKKHLQIPGFRKGKAPESEIQKHLTPKRIYGEVFQVAIQPAFEFANKSAPKINPSTSPEPKLTKVNDTMMEIEFVFDLLPEIKLGQYTDIKTIQKATPEVTADDVAVVLKNYQERFVMEKAREKEETIHQGDLVVFDFKGFLDGKIFNGGEAKDYKLVIGSNQFIPGFEDSMIGLKLGKEKIKVTFPKDYSPELGGKESEFELDIKEIRQRILPKIDDELVKDLNLKDITTIQELETKTTNDLLVKKTNEAKNKFVNELIDEIIKNSEIDLPKSAINHQIKDLKKDFEQEVIRQGLTLKDYKKLTKMTDADIEREIFADAKLRLESYLVLTEIKAKEKFEVSEKQLSDKYAELAQQFGAEVDYIKKLLPIDQLTKEIINDQLTNFLYEKNG